MLFVVGLGSTGRCIALDQASGWITLRIDLGCDSFGWRHLATSVSSSLNLLTLYTVYKLFKNWGLNRVCINFLAFVRL